MYNRAEILQIESPIKTELLQFFDPADRLTIYDIGGCEGEDSLRYARLFPNSAIYVFEPLPDNQNLIKDNIRHYKASNIQLVPAALSDTIGWHEFYVSSGQPDGQTNHDWDFGNKSSSLLAPDKVKDVVKWLKFESVITVPTTTIAHFSGENSISVIDFIHMDVQGAELIVLEGAKHMIKNIRLLWLEIAESSLYKEQALRKDIEHFMQAHSFKLIKSSIEDGVGDQLYVNTACFAGRLLLNKRKFKRLRPLIENF
jgi:FkbM family methyltransferase